MPKYILKLTDGPKDYYLEWSTVVDAPVTFGLSLDEFKEFYRGEYGASGMNGFMMRMSRVESHGTSSYHETAEEVIRGNRAGLDETCFSKEQIIDWYCRRREDPTEKGTEHDYEEI